MMIGILCVCVCMCVCVCVCSVYLCLCRQEKVQYDGQIRAEGGGGDKSVIYI